MIVNDFIEVMEDVMRYPQSFFAELIAYEAEQEYLNENADWQKVITGN